MNQVVVVPYPGRGHINPLLNFCHLLSSRLNQPNRTTVFTIVVTEEWLGIIDPDRKQANSNILFAAIPNVLPSELNRGSNMITFLTAVRTKMQPPFEEQHIGRCPPPMFSLMHHIDLLESHNHLYIDESERGHEHIDYIPGIPSLTIADIPMVFHAKYGEMFKGLIPNPLEVTKKANYVLLSTIYELEPKVIDALRSKIQIPIYTCGLNIPYSQIEPNLESYGYGLINWLDSKPLGSVLYVSFGSYLPVSSAEMGEIAAGLAQSGVYFLWVARGETSCLKEMCGEKGMMVDWCDQLRVLLHSSIGGVLESLWVELGEREYVFRKEMRGIERDKIAEVVRKFMDSKSVQRLGMMERVKKVQEICQESGSSEEDLKAFVNDMVTNQKSQCIC
ncbi:unnamed protein product [Lactuca virosa]|uniref:Uncharacterized protein n=1 Tax=Lactuca virosa TaxID=75947 RepID=A0AAU9LTN0_9ASTR|nr:unnamed protein product [Lactuca virosa]